MGHTLRSVKLNKKREQLFNEICKELSSYGDDELLNGFSEMGAPDAPWAEAWASKKKQEIRRPFSEESEWHLIELFRGKDLADFVHWGRSEFLSIDEITWLSVGLEPRDNFIGLAKPSKKTSLGSKHDEVADYMTRHRELIRRRFDPKNFGDHPDLMEVQLWIEQVSLDVHTGFADMLEVRANKSAVNDFAEMKEPVEDYMDGREKVSMAKLIAAMAIDAYGYDPKARRSNIPTEIQGIADRLGLIISSDTIRKYLKSGAELVPEDWEPE